MGKKADQFKALPWWAKLLVVTIAVALGFGVYSATSSAVKKNQAVDACTQAVKVKVPGGTVSDTHTTDAAQGRTDVTGKVTGANPAGIVMQATFDCLVDGDGSNADVEILG